ncbi:WGxxGxxG family protein [Cohnella cellulosilytica]|uniref:WGxxGxxG family protein n=1 Tax=Cohnella cellulosilytica TaxID=986710 RepID=A0ABW2F9F0_9BACL
MNKTAASLALGTCIALASVIPASAHAAGTTGTAGDMISGATPTRTYGTTLDRTNNGNFGTYSTNGTYNTNGANGTYAPNGVYGNGMYGTNGTYDSTRMNAYRPHNATTNMTTRANNTVRRMETTTRTGFSWGWLGLLGLFGLAGMRSRSREDAR